VIDMDRRFSSELQFVDHPHLEDLGEHSAVHLSLKAGLRPAKGIMSGCQTTFLTIETAPDG
jgi:hypothetical protein